MSPRPERRVPRAIVLAGGGARGAYEAGVLRYLLDELPRRLGRPLRFNIICGTSVGAIHACYLAAVAAAPAAERPGAHLAATWRGLRIEEVFPQSLRDWLRLPGRLIGLRAAGAELRAGRLPRRLHGVFDPTRLEEVVTRSIAWRTLRENIDRGRVEAVAITATEIATGRAVVFVDRRGRRVARWTRDPLVVPRAVRLTAAHALASASIPVLFPAVRLGRQYYADGGLRLNTPLAPALRLGAQRVLVIALRYGPVPSESETLSRERIAAYGNPIFLFGKVLNALLLDRLEGDLAQLHLMNEVLRTGCRAYGPEFLERLNALADRHGERRLRVIEDLVIRPSQDLGVLAGQAVREARARGRLPRWLRLLLRSLGTDHGPLESDFLSYLLFDERYVEPLLELGQSDARAHEEELARFFGEPEAGAAPQELADAW